MNRLLLLGSVLLWVLSGCGGGSGGDSGGDSSDTTAPAAPTVTSLSTENTTATITGTFDASDNAGGFTVQVNGVTYALGTDVALSNSGNSWSLTIPAGSELALGTYEIVATATDGSGNATSDSTSNELVIVDTTAPEAPTVTSLTTESTTATITGTFDASDIAGGFSVQVNGVTYTLGTDAALSNSGNSWSLTIPAGSELALGTYEIVATATDGSGNAATDSSSNELVIVDTTAPAAPTVTSLSTENTTATITGTFDASDIAGGFTIQVNGVTYALGTDAALSNSGNSWSLTIPAGSELALGTYEIVATATDGSGNATSDSTSNELVIVDTTAPAAPTVTSLSTENTTPTITGTFDSSDYAGGFTVGVNGVTYALGTDAALSNSGNSWSLTIPAGSELALGSYEVVATATDGSGNAASDSSSNELVVQDITAPTVSSVTPLSGATDVALSSTITATFNEDIFAASVDGSSFTLAANNSVSGTVSFDGASNIATFTPDSNLDLAANYSAKLTTGISDLVGNGLASDYSWSFITADGSWGTDEVAENDATNTFNYPSVVLEDNGDAIVVWKSSDIWANRYVTGSGWGTPELIETNANPAYSPHIAGDGNGNAIAVWGQSDGTKRSIWANRYVAGSGWGTAELIENDDAGDAYDPRIVFDGSGNATAVWKQSDGTGVNTIVTNRYTAGSGWGSAEIIGHVDLGYVSDTWIAASGNGDVIAIWQQFDGVSSSNTWVNRYDAAVGHWDGAVKIENMNAVIYSSFRIAMDSSGNATAVFSYNDGSSLRIYANRYVAGSGWSGPVAIDDNSGSADYPWVTQDDNGNAVVIWQVGGNSIWANRYTAGTGWGTPELIDKQTGYLSEEWAQVASDAHGNAIAIWIQNDGTAYSLWANRYVAGSGWKGAERIENDDSNSVYNYGVSSLAINGRGQAMAVWRHSSGGLKDDIRANRFE